MKLNKFFILISLLLVLVVSMSMVSATEDIKSDISTEDIDNVALNDMSVDEEIVNLEGTNDDSNQNNDELHPNDFDILQRAINAVSDGGTFDLKFDLN